MPEIEIQMRKRKKVVGVRWRMYETYIKVKGVWCAFSTTYKHYHLTEENDTALWDYQ
jgi:transposase-like protein